MEENTIINPPVKVGDRIRIIDVNGDFREDMLDYIGKVTTVLSTDYGHIKVDCGYLWIEPDTDTYVKVEDSE